MSNCDCQAADCVYCRGNTGSYDIDEWRAKHWGQAGSCGHCGDPVILADTEDWPVKLCFDCWFDAGGPSSAQCREGIPKTAVFVFDPEDN